MNKHNKSVEHAEEVQDVLAYRPAWIVRNGGLLLFSLILAMLAITCIIQYPDVIKSPARLRAKNPPKMIKARTDGRITELFVQDSQRVEEGQHLAVLESTASYAEIIEMSKWIDKAAGLINQNHLENIFLNAPPMLNKLGELQGPYQKLVNDFVSAKETVMEGYYPKKIAALRTNVGLLEKIKKSTENRNSLQEADRSLQLKELAAYEELAREKVIAPLELNQYKSKLLNKDQSIEQTSSQVINSDILTHAKNQELIDLYKQMADQQQVFRSSILELKSRIDEWIHRFVLTASESGKVFFVTSISENELVSNNQSLFFVFPDTTAYYVEIATGQRGFGKIKKGQNILLRVDGYPSDEYGSLKASVDYISLLPTRSDSFIVRANLSKGLTTNFGRTLYFNDQMSATADILTDKRRLIDRIFSQFRKVVTNNP